MPGSEGCKADEPAEGVLVGLKRMDNCWSFSPEASLLEVPAAPAAGAGVLAVAHARRSLMSGIGGGCKRAGVDRVGSCASRMQSIGRMVTGELAPLLNF